MYLTSQVLIPALIKVNNPIKELKATTICNRVTNVPHLGEVLYEAKNCATSKD
jgi:hypothetical protein